MSLCHAGNKMDHTSRMVALLARMRRERNGVVADTMRYYGKDYGLNYGVSLPTVRQIARTETHDQDFARMLWQQDVRELKLAALHIAEPERFTSEEANWWVAGVVNSELAEEAAFALLRHTPYLHEVAAKWMNKETPLLSYAAMLAAARSVLLTEEWIQPTLAIAHETTGEYTRCVAQGAIVLLDALVNQNETSRQAVLRAVGPLEFSDKPEERFIREELLWRSV